MTTAQVTGADLIAAERQRQIDVEKWDDSRYTTPDLALAAAAYAMPADRRRMVGEVPAGWPWETRFWKPTPDDRVRELVKAGALIAAEIDRVRARDAAGGAS